MGMPETLRWTAEQVRTLPDDGKRYEVVDGELLVTPAPAAWHQRALKALLLKLDPYLVAEGTGELLWSPADIELDPRTLGQPDLFVLPLENGHRLSDWRDVDTLVLAIEVLSPSTARYDRLVKRRLFQRLHIEYWIVDLDARVIERWRAGEDRPEVLADRLEWKVPGGKQSLVLDVEGLFQGLDLE